MLFRSVAAAIAFALALSSPTGAGEVRQSARAVLELFTSQGCPSSPVADALLTELGQDPGIIALAYHIDYWDYTGWSDTFGAEANSDRQRDYAQSWGSSSIFTPQMIVNGAEGVVGSRREEVSSAVDGAMLHLPISLRAEDDVLEIAIAGQAGLDEAVVWLVTFLDRAEVTIERGENEGKKLTYSQIVTGRQALGVWEPGAGAHLKLPLSEVLGDNSTGAAILVQEEQGGLPGRILGAASFIR